MWLIPASIGSPIALSLQRRASRLLSRLCAVRSQDVSEGESMLPHLMEMFGPNAELAPEWDRERKCAT